MAAQPDRGVPLSTLCPKFLHTNSTSHTWPFSAIAELIDNAYDPDVNAKQFWIDKTVVNKQDCLSFMDNGNGLEQEGMHKMLSFGYSDKTPVNGVQPIGIYGNGFKSGSMRLGKDAVVFSKSKKALCVGMLSQTYLQEIGAKQIIVPIVCFEQKGANNLRVREEHRASLQDILRYSPFKTEQQLLDELNIIGSLSSSGTTGTRVIIWNLRRTSTGASEFDFEQDRYDIRIPSDVNESSIQASQHVKNMASYIPESEHSLRAYCSILYLKPRMQVIIRGQKVKSQLIAKSLAHIRKDHYKPIFLSRRVPITFGYNTKSKDQYGIMMYHKNRLIKAYERVGCQLRANNNNGVGVIGVIECNFLDPTHNKQNFMENDKYRRTMNSLAIKLEDYWKEIDFRKTSDTPVEDTVKRPDQNWVQCDDCLRWRKLPDGIDCSKLPDKWSCNSNPDPQFRSCQVEEEPEDSDEDEPTYRKTYKQQGKEDKRQQEKKRQRTVPSPSTPTTSRSRFITGSHQGGAARAKYSPLSSFIVSQAACSPSSNNSLPVISNVRSLSTGPLRGKRTQPANSLTTPKKPRGNGVRRGTSDTPSLVAASPISSPLLSLDDSDDTDDDLFILETTRPKTTGFDLNKVKTEERQSESHVDVALECGDAAAVDEASETAGKSSSGSTAAVTSRFPAPPPVASTTTQTEVTTVKVEMTDGAETTNIDEQPQIEYQRRAAQSTSNTEQRLIQQELPGDTQDGNKQCQTFQIDVKYHPDSGEDAGSHCADACGQKDSSPHCLTLTEVQQQDQLKELLQATAQERDSLKKKVHQLTCELQEMQIKLQELTLTNVKKEWSHQASQTEETVEEGDYGSVFHKARQKIDKEALQAPDDTKPRNAQRSLRELDLRENEMDELRSQLPAEKAQEGSGAIAGGDAAGPACSAAASSSDASKSLIELRHNVGRLLVSFMPALELSQVNYECDVIDEIFEQFLLDETSVVALGLMSGLRKE